MFLLQLHPEFYKSKTAHNMKREIIDSYTYGSATKKNEVFWKLFGESAKAYQRKKTVTEQIKQMEEVTLLQSKVHKNKKLKGEPSIIKFDKKNPPSQESLPVGIQKLEERRAKVFEVYKNNFYKQKDVLLTTVISNPDSLVNRYFEPMDEAGSNKHAYEREIIEEALKKNSQFIATLEKLNKLDAVLDIILEHDKEAFKRITKALLTQKK